MFYGLRTSLMVGVMSGFVAMCLGMCVGLFAAYFGGRVDTVIMRIVDLQLSFPSVLVALILLAILGPRRRQDHHRSGYRAVGVLRPDGAWDGSR